MNILYNILVLLPKIVQTVTVQLYYEGIEVARHSFSLLYPDLRQCTPLGFSKINVPTNFANQLLLQFDRPLVVRFCSFCAETFISFCKICY